jgi:hypothetical protein
MEKKLLLTQTSERLIVYSSCATGMEFANGAKAVFSGGQIDHAVK